MEEVKFYMEGLILSVEEKASVIDAAVMMGDQKVGFQFVASGEKLV